MRFLLDRLKEKSTIVSVLTLATMCGASVSPEVAAVTTEALPQIAGGVGLLLTTLMSEKTVK